MFDQEEGPFDALIESTEPSDRQAALVAKLKLILAPEEAFDTLAIYIQFAHAWRKTRPVLVAELEKLRDETQLKVDSMAAQAEVAAKLAERNIYKWASMQLQATQRGKKAAEKKHSKPGGSREKREAIRSIWSQGNYSSRDLCAEQECAALGMSFSVARKALRGTPLPPSRSAA